MSGAKQTDDATFEDRINTAPGPDINACYDDSKGLKALLEISAGQHCFQTACPVAKCHSEFKRSLKILEV